MRQANLQNIHHDGLSIWMGKLGQSILNLRQKLGHKVNRQTVNHGPIDILTYKYVRFKYGVIVFPPSIQHRDMSDACTNLGKPISAGFVSKNDEGVIECYGRSISLRLMARSDDTEALDHQLQSRKSA